MAPIDSSFGGDGDHDFKGRGVLAWRLMKATWESAVALIPPEPATVSQRAAYMEAYTMARAAPCPNSVEVGGGTSGGLAWASQRFDALPYPNLSLSGANLSRANLSGSDLSWSNLSRANLSGSDLSWSNLWRANLSGANLSRANLTGANLWRANLSGANLSRANLSGSDLSWSGLSGSDLEALGYKLDRFGYARKVA